MSPDSENVFLVWKIPAEPMGETEGWDEVGIYPSGELMAVCPTQEAGLERKAELEHGSPSECFGATMEDAPYQFVVSERRFTSPEAEAG